MAITACNQEICDGPERKPQKYQTDRLTDRKVCGTLKKTEQAVRNFIAFNHTGR
jgi:hypothetical protein